MRKFTPEQTAEVQGITLEALPLVAGILSAQPESEVIKTIIGDLIRLQTKTGRTLCYIVECQPDQLQNEIVKSPVNLVLAGWALMIERFRKRAFLEDHGNPLHSEDHHRAVTMQFYSLLTLRPEYRNELPDGAHGQIHRLQNRILVRAETVYVNPQGKSPEIVGQIETSA